MATLAPLTVSSDYGYVILAASSAALLSLFHVHSVFTMRGAIKLPFPHTIATTTTRSSLPKKPLSPHSDVPSSEYSGLSRDEFIFNCAQRAHANYLENLPVLLVSLLLSGVAYPKTAAAMAAGWTVARTVYMVGYMKPEWGKNGSGRLRYGGLTWWLFQIGLVFLSGWVGVKTVLGL